MTRALAIPDAVALREPAMKPPRHASDVVRSPGRPLDATVRASLEPRFGRSFAEVRVHTDASAAASADAVNADAYTVGNHIAFGPGQYELSSSAGQRLLAHELTHVTQQSQGGSPVLQRQPKDGSDDDVRLVPSGMRIVLPDGTSVPAPPLVVRDGVEELPTTYIYGKDQDENDTPEAQAKRNAIKEKYDEQAREREKDRQNSFMGYVTGVTIGLFPMQAMDFLESPSWDKAGNIGKSTAKGLIPPLVRVGIDAMDDKAPAPREKMTAQDWGQVTAPLWGMLFGAATGGFMGAGESAPWESGLDVPSRPVAMPPGGASKVVSSGVPNNCGTCEAALLEGRGSTSGDFASRSGAAEGLRYVEPLKTEMAGQGVLTGPTQYAATQADLESQLAQYPEGSQAMVLHTNPPINGVAQPGHYISALVGKGGKIIYVDAQPMTGITRTAPPTGTTGFWYFGVVPVKR